MGFTKPRLSLLQLADIGRIDCDILDASLDHLGAS